MKNRIFIAALAVIIVAVGYTLVFQKSATRIGVSSSTSSTSVSNNLVPSLTPVATPQENETANEKPRCIFDCSGKLVEIHEIGSRVSTFQYNQEGKLVALKDANGRSLNWIYDSNGNLIKQTNSEGQANPMPTLPQIRCPDNYLVEAKS